MDDAVVGDELEFLLWSDETVEFKVLGQYLFLVFIALQTKALGRLPVFWEMLEKTECLTS